MNDAPRTSLAAAPATDRTSCAPSGAAARSVRRRYYAVHALTWFAAVLPMPVHVLLAAERGFDLQQIGWTMGLYAATVALLELPTGGLADAYGRKRIALASVAVHAVASLALLVAFDPPALFAYAALLGLARALGSGALAAWFVDALREAGAEAEVQPSLAGAGTVQLIALAAGTLAGGAIPMAFPHLAVDVGSVWTPLATPVAASVAMHGVALLATAIWIRESRRTRSDTDGAGRTHGPAALLRDAWTLLRTRPVLPLLLATQAAAGFALFTQETFWQPFLSARLDDATDRTWIFGAVLAGSFLAGTVGNLTAAVVGRRARGRHADLAAAAVVVQAAALAGLATGPGAAGAIACFWLAYGAMGVAASPLGTLFHAEVPSGRRAAMLSLLSLTGFAGSFVASLLLGAVAQTASLAVAWGLAAGALAFGAAVLVRAGRRAAVRVAAPGDAAG